MRFPFTLQQVAMADTETDELIERRLDHANGEAKKFMGFQWPFGHLIA
jgi:hypothetical protein